MTVEEAQAALAAAEKAVQDAKGKGVSAAIAASKALSAAKKNLTAAQKGVSTEGKTRTQVLQEQRAVDFKEKATERAKEDVPVAPGSEFTFKGYDITQRPEAPPPDENYIYYYSWIGGASTGQWKLYQAPRNAANMATYGARSVGGTTQAAYGTSSSGANALIKKPTPIKDKDGNIIGWSSSTDSSNTGKTEVSRKTNPDGSITITYSDGTTSTIPAPSGKTEVSRTTNADGSITITYSDGTTATIPASTGKTETGRKTNADGSITITYSDGTTSTIPASSGDGSQYTGSDPAILALIQSLKDQIANLTTGNAATAAATEAAKKLAERQSAFDVLRAEMDALGLAALVEPLRGLIQKDVSPSEFAVELRQSEAYKARFAANEGRLKKGLRVLTPGEYLRVEDAYRQTLRTYGLKQFDNDQYVRQFIENDISAAELSDRVATAVQRVQNADPAISRTLRDYYGIGQTDLVAYVLDPNQQLQKIQRQVAAAEIGVAARKQGLEAGVTVAEQLAAQGITEAQAQKGYATIADILPTSEKLSQIYGTTLEGYSQTEAEQEVFNTLASAQRKRQRLVSREVAEFTGQAGVGRGSLATPTGGQY